jgi:DNA repair protein RadB
MGGPPDSRWKDYSRRPVWRVVKVPLECPSLDELLEGGVEAGALTLLYGEAGSGKTNLCLQLARNVAREKKVVYIDTEGVSLERLRQIAGDEFETVVENILFFEPYDFAQQGKMVAQAAKLAEGSQDVGLIIFDSATLHFRLARKEDSRDERKSLTGQITRLLGAARKKKIPVVVTSQVYTDVDRGTYEPLGGHVMQHTAKAIVRLEKTGRGTRIATLMKHRHLAEGRSTEFRLTMKGVE